MKIENSKQILQEKRRLKKRKEELRQQISTDWQELTGQFRFGRKAQPKSKQKKTAFSANGDGEGENILASTLAYAGAMLGRKLAEKVNEKLADYFEEEEEE